MQRILTTMAMGMTVVIKKRLIMIMIKILASLLHDDVIDHAESRRGKESVNKRFNPSRSTPAFIVSFNYIIINIDPDNLCIFAIIATSSFRSIFAGDYILGVSAKLLAQTGNPDVVIAMSQV